MTVTVDLLSAFSLRTRVLRGCGQIGGGFRRGINTEIDEDCPVGDFNRVDPLGSLGWPLRGLARTHVEAS
jgi:hypothetical protein